MSEGSSAAAERVPVITLYATPWCGACRRAKRWLEAHGIPYEEINLAHDTKAVATVRRLTDGRPHVPHVPTMVFPDRSGLVDLNDHDLAVRCFPNGETPGQGEDKHKTMNTTVDIDESHAPAVQEISYPRFAAFYNRLMRWSLVLTGWR